MPKTAFLFPGQGAQSVGMGKQVLETLPAAHGLFEEASALLSYNLADVCVNGPAERLNTTAVSQPALYVASLAALESLRASDPATVESCAGTAGLSLGEYTALVFAGALSFADGLRVVKRRGEAMQAAAEASAGAMVSIIGPDESQVRDFVAQARCAGVLEVANLLCPGNTVVSGSTAGCTEVEKLAQAAGARTVRLAVAGAFHTALMRPADEALAEALRSAAWQAPRIPVWSNVDGKPHTNPKEIQGLLVRQVLSPVLWEASLRDMLAAGFDRFYEIGPGRVLAGLLKRVQRKAECHNIGA
jgi:[acyl-carrier-protein] S-malonyltransferase